MIMTATDARLAVGTLAMALALCFIVVNITAIALMTWRRSDNIIGAYVVAGLIWAMGVPILQGWHAKLFG